MKRRNYTVEFKTRTALEAIRGQRSINEIASGFDIHPNVVSLWKKQALTNLPEVFKTSGSKEKEREAALIDRIIQQVRHSCPILRLSWT